MKKYLGGLLILLGMGALLMTNKASWDDSPFFMVGSLIFGSLSILYGLRMYYGFHLVPDVGKNKEKELKEEDPEAHQGIVGTINKAQRQIDKVNAEMEEYCKKYPHKQICKDYKKNGPRTLDMKW